MQIELLQLEFVPVYIGKRAGIKNVKTKTRNPGIYFIKENGILVYIGMSKYNVKEVLYRHFQCWNEDIRQTNHYRVCYKEEIGVNNYEVAVYLTDEDVLEKEVKLISKYKPRDNKKIEESYTEEMVNDFKNEGVIINNNKDLPF